MSVSTPPFRKAAARVTSLSPRGVRFRGHPRTNGLGHDRPLVEGWFGACQSMSLARLLKQMFEVDIEHCPNCGGELTIIAAILEQSVIERIL